LEIGYQTVSLAMYQWAVNMRVFVCILFLWGLGAFTAAAQGTTTLATTTSAHLNAKAAARRFVDVVERLKPVAEQICHARAPQRACELRIVVDSRPNQPPNAYQTVDA
jgi:hypothetical protein